MKNLLVITSMLLFGCSTQKVDYVISDKYIGPCIIFVYPNNDLFIESKQILIQGGLGRIKERDMKRSFSIRSLERKEEISILPIGQDTKASDSVRYVFQLTKGFSSSRCSKEDIQTITFYIGYKSDYDKWYNLHQSEFDFFDSKGTDWCDYYRNHK